MKKGVFGTRPPHDLQMFNRITTAQLLPSAPFFINTVLCEVHFTQFIMSFLDKIGIKKSRDGRSKQPLYKHWKSMMNLSYGRDSDILVDSRWHNFWNFNFDLNTIYDKKYKYFCRIDANKEWTLGNVWFTNSARKSVFGRTTTHKVQVDNITMSTIQIKQDLEAKGINVSHQTITNRVREKKEILNSNAHKSYLHNGKNMSLRDISKLENIDYPTLKYWAKRLPISDAISNTKANLHRQRFYEYDGQTFNQSQLAIYLSSKNKELSISGIRNRLKKGLSPDECLKGMRGVSLHLI